MEIADKLTDLRRKAGGSRYRHCVLRDEVSKVVRAAGLPTKNYANYLGEFGEKFVLALANGKGLTAERIPQKRTTNKLEYDLRINGRIVEVKTRMFDGNKWTCNLKQKDRQADVLILVAMATPTRVAFVHIASMKDQKSPIHIYPYSPEAIQEPHWPLLDGQTQNSIPPESKSLKAFMETPVNFQVEEGLFLPQWMFLGTVIASLAAHGIASFMRVGLTMKLPHLVQFSAYLRF